MPMPTRTAARARRLVAAASPAPGGRRRAVLIVASLSLAVLAVAACSSSSTPSGSGPAPTPGTSSESTVATASPAGSHVGPPKATPLPTAPAEPAGDGTKVRLDTAAGTIVIELYTKSAPVAAENFATLAVAGFYDGVVFHRILPGFMIQGGDPTGTGGGGPGYAFPDEPFAGEYTRGTVAMANAGPNTNGSQFFILVADYPLPHNYTIFGHVTSGMDVVDRIVAGPRGGPRNDRALEPVAITRASVERP
jgi:cyclophilin family peptidyl-prolyl cis-trans isomerase